MKKSKLPRSIISKLEEEKDENEEWIVGTFRKRLKRYAQKARDQQSRLHHSRSENILRKNANSPSMLGSPMIYTRGALLLNEFSSTHKSSKFIFCDGRHSNK